jgi:antitoxin ParD1/3/4
MIVNLPIKLEQFVKNLVLQRRFESEEAAIAEGVRLLVTREELRTEIAKGVRQLDEGDWYDEDTVFAELSAAIDGAVGGNVEIQTHRKSEGDNSWTWRQR